MAIISSVSQSQIASSGRMDAEFHQPIYSIFNSIKGKLDNVDYLGKLSLSVKKGIFDIKPSRYVTSGVPLIRTSQIKSIFSSFDKAVFISEADHVSLYSKTELKAGDIVVSKVGEIGNVSILSKRYNVYNFSQNVAGISVDREKINPYYLIAYMNSTFGKRQLIRYNMPSVQGKLELQDIKKILIIRLGENEQVIASFIENAQSLIEDSNRYRTQGEDLVKQDLNPTTDCLAVGNTRVVSYGDLYEHGRIDAEYYHLKHESLLSKIMGYRSGTRYLGEISKRIYPNYRRTNTSDTIDYIEISNINVNDGTYSVTHIATKELPANAKIRLSGGEILISMVRPTRGAISIIDDNLQRETVCSSAFYVCRVEDYGQRELIWLYLRTICGLFEKYCSGTSYPTIESSYISKIPIPDYTSKLACTVKELIVKSQEAQMMASNNIDEASDKVENYIKEAIET